MSILDPIGLPPRQHHETLEIWILLTRRPHLRSLHRRPSPLPQLPHPIRGQGEVQVFAPPLEGGDSDEFAVGVEEAAAGRAGGDGGVGLDQGAAPLAQDAAQLGDDAAGQGKFQTSRGADGIDFLAHGQGLGRAEARGGGRGRVRQLFHVQQAQVALVVPGQHGRLHAPSRPARVVRGLAHRDARGFLDHVAVGDHFRAAHHHAAALAGGGAVSAQSQHHYHGGGGLPEHFLGRLAPGGRGNQQESGCEDRGAEERRGSHGGRRCHGGGNHGKSCPGFQGNSGQSRRKSASFDFATLRSGRTGGLGPCSGRTGIGGQGDVLPDGNRIGRGRERAWPANA